MHRIATKHYNRMRQLLSTVSVRRFRNKAARAALGIEHSQRLLCLLSSRAVKFSVLLLFIFFLPSRYFDRRRMPNVEKMARKRAKKLWEKQIFFPLTLVLNYNSRLDLIAGRLRELKFVRRWLSGLIRSNCNVSGIGRGYGNSFNGIS